MSANETLINCIQINSYGDIIVQKELCEYDDATQIYFSNNCGWRIHRTSLNKVDLFATFCLDNSFERVLSEVVSAAIAQSEKAIENLLCYKNNLEFYYLNKISTDTEDKQPLFIPTPVLEGEDAINFLKKLLAEENDIVHDTPTPKLKETLKRVREYEKRGWQPK
jgi:hypothetical protein